MIVSSNAYAARIDGIANRHRHAGSDRKSQTHNKRAIVETTMTIANIGS
jgi:hypothetical protein